VGLDDFGFGPLVWTREHEFDLAIHGRHPDHGPLPGPLDVGV
jgi:hypothetical protein